MLNDADLSYIADYKKGYRSVTELVCHLLAKGIHVETLSTSPFSMNVNYNSRPEVEPDPITNPLTRKSIQAGDLG